MIRKIFLLLLFLIINKTFSQQGKHPISIGFNYGFGSEIENTDYTYSNHFYKLQFNYTLNKTNNFVFQILLQPEINFATHQLKNLYFITPDETDYLGKREKFTKLKNIKEYILGLGFLVKKPISKAVSIYILGSFGPMFTDTETERLSKGFAFSEVLSFGISFKTQNITFDIRPSLRHNSNAGLQNSNAGLNTKNIEFGMAIPFNN
jgi:hypothetical protein